jgi:AcrR family transcriptional regulator
MPRQPSPTLADARRRQILDAALVCFARRGFHQATMQEICAEAGISAGALYRYYGSKAELILAIASEDRRALLAPLAEMEPGASLVDALGLMAAAWLEHVGCKDRALIAEVLAEAVRDAPFGQKLAQQTAPVQEALEAAIAQAQMRGEASLQLQPARAARLILAALDGVGLHRLLFAGPDAPSDGEALQDLRLMFEALLQPGPTAPAGLEGLNLRERRA